MTHLNDTMSTSLLTTHKKNAHLTKEERVMIATLKSQGLSNRGHFRKDLNKFYKKRLQNVLFCNLFSIWHRLNLISIASLYSDF